MLSSSQVSIGHASTQAPIKVFLQSIRSTFETVEDAENLLLEALTSLKLVPTGFKVHKHPSITSEEVLNAIPTVQHSILTSVLPVWFGALKGSGRLTLIKQLFCPSKHNPTELDHATAIEIARNGLSSVLAFISTLDVNALGPRELLDFCLSVLRDISTLYPLDVVFESIFLSNRTLQKNDSVLHQCWEDYVRCAASLSGKVMNVLHDTQFIYLSQGVEHGPYLSSICIASERALFKTSQKPLTDTITQALSHLFLKLVNQGLFPSVKPDSTAQPSFFALTLPTIQRRLQLKQSYATSSNVASSSYTETWRTTVQALPFLSQQVFIRSLFASLDIETGIDVSSKSLQKINDGVSFLRGVLGAPTSNDELSQADNIMKMILAVLLNSGKSWDLGLVRIVICWVADPKASIVNEGALSNFLNEVLDVWTNPDHIRHSLYLRQRYVSSLFLMTIAALPQSSNALQQLSFSSPFISSISTFLSHTDLSIRQCGMLVAEVVAEKCRQKLDFGGWDGAGEHVEWLRVMRRWVNDWSREAFDTSESVDVPVASEVGQEDSFNTEAVTVPEAVMDSDDESLTGYSPSDGSSRPPSPTPLELEEMEKDPTLRAGRSKPIPKPVYLAQLVSLLRKSSGDEKDTVEIIEVILNSAELLIRRKKGFGYELEENAVQLTISLLMLRDNYGIDGFNEKRQAALIALVECCPKQVAQTLIEQFFTNQYSTTDRLMILTVLALGARTLAGLADSPTPESSNPKIVFPSKLLPPALHHRYATREEDQHMQVQKVLGGITRLALDKSKDEAEEALIATGNKEISRTRMLRLGSTAKGRRVEILEPTSSALTKPSPLQSRDSFVTLAAEYFIMPLINHMWLYLRDTDTRIRKDAIGSAILLDTTVLAQFLNTLAVLAHAARNSPAFLSIVAPASIEIALTLGSRPIEARGQSIQPDTSLASLATATPATVLTAAMELTLLGLDASTSLDNGQTLALENTALLMAVSTWAGEILNILDRGQRMLKGGGDLEGRLNALVAGVVIKIEKITDKWGRAM